MNMKAAVYSVPPNPSKLNGANAARLFREQSGKRKKVVRSIITLLR